MEIDNSDIFGAAISQKSVENFVSLIDYADQTLDEHRISLIEEAEKMLRSESDRKAVTRELEANLPKEIKEGTVGEYLFSCIESNDPCNPVCITGFKPSNKSECSNPVYRKSSDDRLSKLNSADGDVAMLYVDDDNCSELSKSDAEKLYNDGVREVDIISKSDNKVISRASLMYSESDSESAQSDSPRSSKSPTVSNTRSPEIDIRYTYKTEKSEKKKKKPNKKQEESNWLVIAIIALVFVLIIVGIIWMLASVWYPSASTTIRYESPITKDTITFTETGTKSVESTTSLSDYF